MMIKLLNNIISKLKGHPFEIDSQIPLSYLVLLLIRRATMLFYGLFVFCKKKGFVFIAPNTKIRCRSKLQLGKGVTIERGCYLDALSTNGIILGNNVSLGKYTAIECSGSLQHIGKGFIVKDNVGLGSHGFFGCAGGIEIGCNTIFGNYVSMHSENHIFTDINTLIRLQGVSHKGIRIGENCWIGAKATILDGVNIENGCVIAAGSVVAKGTYLSNGIYGGIPAKLLKTREDYIIDQQD